MKVIWSPLALDKVSAIAEFIALDKPSAAIDWANDVFDLAENLGTQPEIGRVVPELIGKGYREVIHGNYRIIYKIGNTLEILTVRNCRQLLNLGDDEL
ncbi:type II toxin-antitoxin system RelE/ParE family toxin [Thalassotalea nanhaiensis]|uniref:Type II toxin-antitoxin system RelE/ParE family toxin n=1 Tax=Thalassotalea nanhaiensis TaxID=3065648 RepID=A0ABY9TIU8_9GAMM|nr:type II toxin-antitoxin system RelE/ParE family toxin [Colwelliaceae bacterium SQ345]